MPIYQATRDQIREILDMKTEMRLAREKANLTQLMAADAVAEAPEEMAQIIEEADQ